MAFDLGSLTNIFTGAPQVQAAKDQQAAIAAQQAAIQAKIDAAQGQGATALQTGEAGALGAIGGGIGTARSDITGNVPAALDALYQGRNQGASLLTGGQIDALGALRSGVTGAAGAYDPLAALSQKYGGYADPAASLYSGALGAATPEQQAAAVAAFQSSPGYEFKVGQGIDALTRAANVGGGVAGGNVLRESQTFGQGLANQDYQQWLDNLKAQSSLYSPLEASTAGAVAAGKAAPYLTGGTGAANIYSGTAGRLSDLYSGTGTNAANIYTGQGTSLANLAAQGGLASGSVYTGTGSGIANLVSGLTNADVGYNQAALAPLVKSYSDAAAAQTGGSQNLWNLLGGAATFAAGGGFNPASYSQLFSPKTVKVG